MGQTKRCKIEDPNAAKWEEAGQKDWSPAHRPREWRFLKDRMDQGTNRYRLELLRAKIRSAQYEYCGTGEMIFGSTQGCRGACETSHGAISSIQGLMLNFPEQLRFICKKCNLWHPSGFHLQTSLKHRCFCGVHMASSCKPVWNTGLSGGVAYIYILYNIYVIYIYMYNVYVIYIYV